MPEYQQGQTYLEYIQGNVTQINNYQQVSFDWRHDRNGNELPVITASMQNHPEFASAINYLPDRISRDDVQNAFSRSNYEGLIATVLWGGGHRGKFTHFGDILDKGQQAIYLKINRVKDYLEDGQTEQAFISMKRQNENYINGIAESFFTKVMYFLTRGKEYQETPRPLIWDQFLQFAHCAILIDSEGVNHRDFYYLHNNSLRFQQRSEVLYMDFITRMKNICCENGIIRSDFLEAFLFGARGHNSFGNPRYVTKQYVLNNFN